MPNLVLFDIDGTLANSNEVDAICYVRSVQEEFELEKIDDRWETYKHATDSGIFEEIFERAFSRKPSEAEIGRVIARLANLLEEHYSSNPAMFDEIAGASKILQMLRNHPEWQIGIATGAWKESALIKLNSAGIKYEGFPMVTGSDAKTREEILLRCIDLSKEHYGVGEFDKIVSVGDAVWDLKTAANLELGFIGINKPEKFKNYRDCRVMQDFSDQELFMEYLEEAVIPHIP